MRVVAIDPAPKKPSTLYDGREFRKVPASKMRQELREMTSPVLLCWDAPLTGPRTVEEAGSRSKDFSQRCLDSFLDRKDGFKTPKGISVRPYSGCSHWTISRSVLGLPRVGPYDKDFCELPFRLLPKADGTADGTAIARATGSWVVEIHPAVAAWLWCKRHWKGPWEYKKDQNVLTGLWRILCEKFARDTRAQRALIDDDQITDDKLDALVGYILGARWLRNKGDVVLLGDRETGAMLLPRVDDLEEKWAAFRAKWP